MEGGKSLKDHYMRLYALELEKDACVSIKLPPIYLENHNSLQWKRMPRGGREEDKFTGLKRDLDGLQLLTQSDSLL